MGGKNNLEKITVKLRENARGEKMQHQVLPRCEWAIKDHAHRCFQTHLLFLQSLLDDKILGVSSQV